MNALSPERWRQIDELFEAALALPPEARGEFLRARCGNDAELRGEVEALLESVVEAEEAIGESVSQFAEPLVEELRSTLDREEIESLPGGGRIGQYRLLEMIGRGGMGAVYLAERADEQFEKRVALKLVKRGMDTDEVLQRFRYERQILAALEHPNIGRLYDGGAAEDGRPYLVMEHIDGEPVTTYCDERRLSLEARLRLFETICEAVQFAHRNLVIHRDLKPSNILVTTDGTVKLLDFGIAKLLDPSQSDLAPRTRTEMRLLTPEYASPEQMDGAAVTTASDVYSLGVILFELLTGRRPVERRGRRTQDRFGLDTGRGRPSSAVVRPLRLELEGSAEIPAGEIAGRRGTTPERLRSRLRGDLDTITLKALAEEPDRRYQSAEQLLADIQRYRRGLPVLARGESIGYRATKFVRRNRTMVSLSGAITLLLLGFVSTTFMQNSLLREARSVADVRRGQAEDMIGYMLGDLAGKLDPLGRLDLLDDVAVKAGEYFATAPPDGLSTEELLRRSEQLRLLGDVQRRRGDLPGAAATFAEAYDVSSGLVALDSANAEWRLGLATDYFWAGNISYLSGDHARALELFELNRSHVERLHEAHPDERLYQLELSYAHGNVGSALEALGRREAIEEYDRSLELKRRLAEEEPDNLQYQATLATAYNKLAVAEQRWGDLRSAEAHFRAELVVRQEVFARSPSDRNAQWSLALAHGYLGELLAATGDAPGSLEHRLAALDINGELVRWDAENAQWRRALAISSRLAGMGLAETGRRAEGLEALRTSISAFEEMIEERPDRADYQVELAKAQVALAAALRRGAAGDAAAAADAARAALRTLSGSGDPLEGSGAKVVEGGAQLELGRALARLGDAAAAEAAWTRAVQVLEQGDGENLERRARLSAALLHLGRAAEARPIAGALLEQGYRPEEFVRLAARHGVTAAPRR